MADSGARARRLRGGWQALGFGMVALVWWGCLTPSPPGITPLFPQFDKFEHFTAYLVLAGWFAAIHTRWRARIAVLCLLVLMGGVIEMLQYYTGRDAEWLDWLADIAGVVLGLTAPAIWLRMLYRHVLERYAQAA